MNPDEIVEDEYLNEFCVRCGNQIEVDSLGREDGLCKECYIEKENLMNRDN
jgi:NMD protein affecting ribosome stability and mRNA decay